MAAMSSVPSSRIAAPRETRSPNPKQRQAPRRRYSESSAPAAAKSPSPQPELPSYLQAGPRMNGGVPQLSRKFVARRISEGETGRLKEELKCQACGKGYKHVSSLAKHLWEHTPEWNLTSKLLISKHQQVQLLEAASILVSMNEEDEEAAETNESNDQNQNQNSAKKQSTPGVTPELDPDESPSPTMDTDESALSGESETRDIPIASGRAISKSHHVHLSVGSYHRARRVSTNLGTSPAIASSLLSMAQASPIPESAFRNRDRSHMPPSYANNRNSSSTPPENNDDDELQDPSHENSKDLGVFGDMDD